MKKLLLLLTTFFFAVSLTGCFLQPEDVEEISEQFCRDNPSNEICQGDVVEDLTNEAILNVFNIIISEYNDATNTTFCTDYFSVTNIDLLDECRANRLGLVPNEFEGYTVEDVKSIPSLSTQKLYEITAVSADLLTTVVFTVGVVNVEGIMYISAWDYETTTINPQDVPLTKEIVQAFFEQFIDDYLDDNITSALICQNYMPQQTAAECTSERDESLALNMTVILKSFTEGSDGYYVVVMTFNDDEMTEPEDQTEEVKFTRDINGDILMEFKDREEPDPVCVLPQILIDGVCKTPDIDPLSYDSLKLFIEEFIVEFNDDNKTPEAVCTKYFDPEDLGGCEDGKSENDTKNGVVSLDTFTDETDFYIIIFRFTYPDSSTDLKDMKVTFYLDSQENVKIDVLDDSTNQPTLREILDNLALDFNDPDMTGEQVCAKYMLPDFQAECAQHVNESKAAGETIIVKDFFEEDGIFKVIFEYKGDDGTTWEESNEVVFHFDDDNNFLGLEFSGGDPTNFFREFLEGLVDDFNNPDVTAEMYCQKYMEADDQTGCLEGVKGYKQDGVTAEMIEFFNEGDMFIAKFEYKDTSNNTWVEAFIVEFYQDENNQISVRFNSEPDPAQKALIEALVADYNNPDVTAVELCQKYFAPEEEGGCVEHIAPHKQGNVHIELLKFVAEGDRVRVVFEYNDGLGNIWEEENYAVFYTDNNGVLKVKFEGGDPYSFLYNLMKQLVDDFNNDSMSDAQICDSYFYPEDVPECVNGREELRLNEYTISLETFEPSNDNMYRVVFRYVNSTDDFTREVFAQFEGDNEGNVYIRFRDQQGEQVPWDDAQAFLDNYVQEFNSSISSQDFCSHFIVDYRQQDCIGFREDIRSRELQIIEYFLYFDRDRYQFEFVFSDQSRNLFEAVFVRPNDILLVELHQPGPQMVEYEKAWNHLNQFAIDVLNSDITDAVLCTMYFYPDTYNYDGCEAIRREIIQANIVEMTVFDLFSFDGKYEVKFQTKDNDNNQWDITYRFAIFYGEGDKIWMMFESSHGPNNVDYDTAWNHLQAFIESINTSTYPLDALCSDYFINEDFHTDNCHGMLQSLYDNGYTITLKGLDFMDEEYHVVVEYFDGVTSWDEHWELIIFYVEDNIIKMAIPERPGPNLIPYDDVWNLFQQFVADYLNPALTDDQFCITYFPWIDAVPCFGERSEMNLANVQYNINYFHHDFDNQYWAEFYVTDDSSNEWWYTVKVDFKLDEMNNIFFDIWFDHGMPSYMGLTDAEAVFRMYVADYNDENVSTDYINDKYFGNNLDQGFYDNRNGDLTNGVVYEVTSFTDPMNGDGFEYFEARLNMTKFGETYEMILHLRVIDLGDSRYAFEFKQNDGDKIPFDEATQLLEAYVFDYNDSSLTDDAVCSAYFEDDHYGTCMARREADRNDGIELLLINLTEYDHGFEATFEGKDPLNLNGYTVTPDVYFYRNQDGIYMIEINYNANYDPWTPATPEQAAEIIGVMITEFNDSTIGDEEWCERYGWPIDGCMQYREMNLAIGYTFELYSLTTTADDGTNVKIQVNQGNGLYTYIYLYIYIEFNEDGDVAIWGNQYSGELTVIDDATALGFFTTFIGEYLASDNPTIWLIHSYLGGIYSHDFHLDRMTYINDNALINVVSVIHDVGDPDGYYIVTIDVTINGSTDRKVLHTHIYSTIDSVPVIQIIDDIPTNLNDTQLDTFANGFIADFNDPLLLTEDFCQKYMDAWNQEECGLLREKAIEFTLHYVLDSVDLDEFEHATFKVNVLNELDEIIVVLKFEVYVDLDILYGMHYDVYLMRDYNWEIQDGFTSLFKPIVESYKEGTITLEQLCILLPIDPLVLPVDPLELPVDPLECAELFESFTGKTLQDFSINEIWYEWDNFYEPSFFIRTHYQFDDGTYEIHKYKILYSYNELTNEFEYGMMALSDEIPGPSIMVFLDLIDANTVLELFVADYQDPTILARTLCNTYFGGSMMSPDCVEGRQQFLDNLGVAELTSLEEIVITTCDATSPPDCTVGDVVGYIATFTLTQGTLTEVQEAFVMVYSAPSIAAYYIAFGDNPEEYIPVV